MHAVLQYLLNLEQKNKYTGSGTVYLSGEAAFVIRPKYGELTVKYGINEYVYDTSHHIWKITAIYGTPDTIYYVAFNGQYEQTFQENELISFQDGSLYFNSQYDTQIGSYSEQIQTINEIISVTPDVPPVESNFIHLFDIGEYVFDYNRNIWQVVSLQNTVDNIEYVVREKGTQILATFPEKDLLSLANGISYFNLQETTTINNLLTQIEYIDNLLQTTPVVPPSENNLIVKFQLGQFVYDSNRVLWKIITIQNAVTNIEYLANNGFMNKIFTQDELTDFVEESPYFLSKYDELISQYADKIATLQALIQAKYG